MSTGAVLDRPELELERIDARARGENFPVASLLAPRKARPHLRAIYGFARLVDEVGDESLPPSDKVPQDGRRLAQDEFPSVGGGSRPSEKSSLGPEERLALLDAVERELDGPPGTEIMRRLHATIAACGLPREPFTRLIEANRIDQRRTRYESWADLREYCAHSAEPVGRLVLAVYGRADDPQLVAWSDDVCTGLQLVNFLQDPPRDLALGRVYLPQEDLRRFHVLDAELAGPASERLASLLAFEAGRARGLLAAGLPLAAAVGGRAGRSIALFARGGLAALAALERSGFDVFARRPAPGRLTLARLAAAELLRP